MPSLVSAPWASPADIPLGTPAAPTPWTWDLLLGVASDILFELTGRQWRGQGRSRVQIVRAGTGNAPNFPVPSWVPLGSSAPLPGGLYGGAWGGWGWSLPAVVKLPSSPVSDLTVWVGTDATNLTDEFVLDPSCYSVDSAGQLRREDGYGWDLEDGVFAEYTSGLNPPDAGRMSCVALAMALAQVAPGADTALNPRLANFITSISREGTTIQLNGALNIREAITGGYTGLAEVDLWISVANPHKSRGRARVWTPDMGRARRIAGVSTATIPLAPSYVPIVDLAVYEGDDRSFTFPVLDVNNQPFPLAGYSARAQVRKRPGTTVLHEWSTTDGNITIGAGAVTLAVSDSEDWAFTDGVYDLELIDPSGHAEYIARGRVQLTARVTA